MVFGRRKESADEDSKPWEHVNPPLPAVNGLFRQPTDVAWDSEGNIYITDGYINSRVAKYDKNGEWVKSWGTRGTGPGQFNLPHAIAIDRNKTSMWATGRTAAFRSSTPRATFSECSRLMYLRRPASLQSTATRLRGRAWPE